MVSVQTSCWCSSQKTLLTHFLGTVVSRHCLRGRASLKNPWMYLSTAADYMGLFIRRVWNMIRLATNTFPHLQRTSRAFVPPGDNGARCRAARTDTSPLEAAPRFEVQRREVVHEHSWNWLESIHQHVALRVSPVYVMHSSYILDVFHSLM